MEIASGLTYILLLLFLLPFVISINKHVTNFRHCLGFLNKRFTASPLIEVNSNVLKSCTAFCGRTVKCSYFVYNWNTKTCLLYEKRDFTSQIVSTSDKTTLYYDGNYKTRIYLYKKTQFDSQINVLPTQKKKKTTPTD